MPSHNFKDLTGQKFGKLTVINRYPHSAKTMWECICDCGNKKVVFSSNLIRSNTKSCGCSTSEFITNSKITHNFSKTRLYACWNSMKKRCLPKYWEVNPSYTGVIYSPLWKTFEGFRNNQPKGRKYENYLVLSRIGDKGDYTPENCRWVTKSENAIEASSHRQHKYRLVNGESAVSVAVRNGLPFATFYRRIQRGWSVEEACSIPIKRIT